MTKNELIKALERFDDNMEVFIAERKTEFAFGLVNSVRKQEVVFSEDPDYVTEVNSTDNVIIISEE